MSDNRGLPLCQTAVVAKILIVFNPKLTHFQAKWTIDKLILLTPYELPGGTLNAEVIDMLVGNFFLKTLKNTQILILNP